MQKRYLPFIALFTICFALAGTAHAQGALDRDTITRWMSAATELQTWAEGRDDFNTNFEDEFDDRDGMPSYADIERLYLEMFGNNREATRIIDKHGFGGAEEWADVSARITLGLLSLEIEAVEPEMNAQMAQAMRELQNSPHIPQQQREMMLAQMQQAMGVMDSMTEGVREEDLPAIRSMREELKAFINIGDDEDDDGW